MMKWRKSGKRTAPSCWTRSHGVMNGRFAGIVLDRADEVEVGEHRRPEAQRRPAARSWQAGPAVPRSSLPMRRLRVAACRAPHLDERRASRRAAHSARSRAARSAPRRAAVALQCRRAARTRSARSGCNAGTCAKRRRCARSSAAKALGRASVSWRRSRALHRLPRHRRRGRARARRARRGSAHSRRARCARSCRSRMRAARSASDQQRRRSRARPRSRGRAAPHGDHHGDDRRPISDEQADMARASAAGPRAARPAASRSGSDVDLDRVAAQLHQLAPRLRLALAHQLGQRQRRRREAGARRSRSAAGAASPG